MPVGSLECQIRFGLVGSGFMGRTYAEVITQYLPCASLAAVTGGKRAPEIGAIYSVPVEYSLETLLAREDVDAVIIATPHSVHAEQALAAARAGKHILIEKPMAATIQDCDAILTTCQSEKVVCGVAFTQRKRVCNVVAKQLIESGKLGRILQIHEWHVAPEGINSLPQWQGQSDNLGVLFGHGIHCIDSIRWLTSREVRTVYAKCRNLTSSYPVEANSNLILTLDDGMMATVSCSFEVPKPGFPRTQFSAHIICEKGLLDLDAYGELRISRKGGDWEIIQVQPPIDWQGKGFLDPVRLESYTRHLEDFVDCALNGRTPSPSGWDGRQAVAVVLAAYESNKTGKEVIL